MSLDELKRQAAAAAITHVKSGMKLGLGTGSTAKHFVDLVGELVNQKKFDLVCVPTSEATRLQAESLGIALTTLEKEPVLDLTVDGADEIDDALNMIKGGGGAHVREKIVATSSRQMIVIVDESKRVASLGKFPLPVEVVPYGVKATAYKIERVLHRLELKGSIVLRVKDGKPFVTDNGNVILDCALGVIPEPHKLAIQLSCIPGVVDHGLFINIANKAYIATASGVAELDR